MSKRSKKPGLVLLSAWLLVSAEANAAQVVTEDSVIGDHAINLKLRPMPVADVLRLLSARSRAVQAQSGQPAWQVDGLDKLDGLFIETDFALTPVDKVVAEVLGCVGFSYLEHGNRIEIVAAERKLRAAECPHITVSTAVAVGSRSAPSQQKTYSWQFESISAANFLRFLASAAQANILRTYTAEADAYLADTMLRVDVSNITEREALGNMLACIGWTYEKTDVGYLVYEAAGRPLRGECKGFTVLWLAGARVPGNRFWLSAGMQT